jgi:hypothetical protein
MAAEFHGKSEEGNRMSDEPKSQISSVDEPLFVLKYRRNRVSLRILGLSIIILFFLMWEVVCLLFFELSFGFFFFVIFFGLTIFFFIREIHDVLSFKEIRLYKDKIVKVWKSMRTREIKLVDAILVTTDYRLRKRWIRDANVKSVLLHSKGIGYCEDLPAADDVKKLNRLLAALSGRRVKELGQSHGQSIPGRLIEEGSSPQANITYQFDEQDVREEKKEKAFNRVAIRALIIYFLFLMLGLGIFITCLALSHR